MTPPEPIRSGRRPCLARSGFAALTIAITVVACGDDPPPPQPTPAPEDAGATQAVSVVVPKIPSATSAVAPSASSAPIPSPSIATPTGPIQWSDFGGPVVKPTAKPGELSWAVIPISSGWDTLKFTLAPADRVEGDAVIFKSDTKRDIFVPGAFTLHATAAEGVSKGDAVLVSDKGSRAFARVTAVENGKIKARFRFAGDIKEVETSTLEVIELDGTLKFGAPAAYSEQKEQAGGSAPLTVWHPAYFVQTSEDKTWVITTSGKPLRLPASTVKPLIVHTAYKAQDKVWFANGEEMVEATVVAVEDDGLRYKLKLASGEEPSGPFETVSAPIK